MRALPCHLESIRYNLFSMRNDLDERGNADSAADALQKHSLKSVGAQPERCGFVPTPKNQPVKATFLLLR